MDKALLQKIADGARSDNFYTTWRIEGEIRALRDADLIDVYDMHDDGRVRWMLTAEGAALLKG